jgi:inner membrane protein
MNLNMIVAAGVLLTFWIPDLDKETSKPGRHLKLISKILSFFTKHRGITHSLIAYVIVAGLFKSLETIPVTTFSLSGLFIGSVIGYGSHLLGDMSTPQGIPLLWPLKIKFRIPILSQFPTICKVIWILLFTYFLMK